MDEALGWAVAAGVCYAGYKLIFGSSSSRRRRDVPQASIDQVLSVFPNVSQAAARWELERNGGSVERAVERALREGGLPEPPASYFPPSPDALVVRPGTPTQAAPAAAGSSASAQAKRGPPPSLIARLGLQDKVASDDKGKAKEAEAASATGWSTSASEREKNLRARKEKLVLEARRKLLEKQARAKEASAAGPSAETSD
ncbi:CUE domain-containing protein [Rhodotorula paludigena]|uniref:CUE domain-containing protein n=1 Tax=Rhodotorula paludigena TaxID=86838 RepID=UPI0031795994